MHSALISPQPVERVKATLRHALARPPTPLSFYRGFPKVKGPSPSAEPVSVSRSRATGCLTLTEFCKQNYIKT